MHHVVSGLVEVCGKNIPLRGVEKQGRSVVNSKGDTKVPLQIPHDTSSHNDPLAVYVADPLLPFDPPVS